jgi:hypothetical protein
MIPEKNTAAGRVVIKSKEINIRVLMVNCPKKE